MQPSRQSLIVLAFGFFAIALFFVLFYIKKNSPPPDIKKVYSVADFLRRASPVKASTISASTDITVTAASPVLSSDVTPIDEEDVTNFNPKLPLGDLALLRRLTTENDVCTIRKYNFKVADILTVIMNAPDTIQIDSEKDRTMYELFSTQEASATNVSVQKSESSVLGSFWTALALSGQLDGVEPLPEDPARALEILEELSAQDPENAVYDYYSTVVLDKLGAPESTVKARFMRAFQKPRYEVSQMRIGQRVYQKSFANSAYFAIGQNARYFLPSPSPFRISFLVSRILKKHDDPAFANAIRIFAQGVLNQNKPTQPAYESIDWNWVEASVAANYQIKSWDEKSGPNPYKRADFTRVYTSQIQTAEAAIENIDKWVNEKPCKADAIDNFVKIQKENYLNHLASVKKSSL